MFKRPLLVFLAICICLLCIPAGVFGSVFITRPEKKLIREKSGSEDTEFSDPEEDITETELFSGPAYTVTVTGGSGSGTYHAGETVYICADVKEGADFKNWVTVDQLEYLKSYCSGTKFRMPDHDVEIEATYYTKEDRVTTLLTSYALYDKRLKKYLPDKYEFEDLIDFMNGDYHAFSKAEAVVMREKLYDYFALLYNYSNRWNQIFAWKYEEVEEETEDFYSYYDETEYETDDVYWSDTYDSEKRVDELLERTFTQSEEEPETDTVWEDIFETESEKSDSAHPPKEGLFDANLAELLITDKDTDLYPMLLRLDKLHRIFLSSQDPYAQREAVNEARKIVETNYDGRYWEETDLVKDNNLAAAGLILLYCRDFTSNESFVWGGNIAVSRLEVLWDEAIIEAAVTDDYSEKTYRTDFRLPEIVGISIPGVELSHNEFNYINYISSFRWKQVGDFLQTEAEAAGYKADLRFAENKNQQAAQVKRLISEGADILVISAFNAESLGEVLTEARERGIPVIAYDSRSVYSDANAKGDIPAGISDSELTDPDLISYFVAFDEYEAGVLQGNYIIDALNLENTEQSFNLEIMAGGQTDMDAARCYQGAMDQLKPYIDSGRLIIPSGEKEFDETTNSSYRDRWDRASDIMESRQDQDAWLCAFDADASVVSSEYLEYFPIITGQGCQLENVRLILAGKQSMSVFRDPRILASQVIRMADQILKGETVDVTVSKVYRYPAPYYLCKPTVVNADNYKEMLVDPGYYSESQLTAD